jgi:nucleoside-diphosphate-sugar epimerase
MAAMGLATEKALRMAVLRPFHVFGKGEHASRLWPSLHSAAMSNKDFLMTKGEQILDFTPVEFAARTFLSVLEQESLDPGITRLLNIGTGRPQTVRSFAEHWWAKWGAKGKLKIGALPYRHNEVMRYVPALYPSSRAIV